jgi:hypothetical protein
MVKIMEWFKSMHAPLSSFGSVVDSKTMEEITVLRLAGNTFLMALLKCSPDGKHGLN